jgi:hypothetical protein
MGSSINWLIILIGLALIFFGKKLTVNGFRATNTATTGAPAAPTFLGLAGRKLIGLIIVAVGYALVLFTISAIFPGWWNALTERPSVFLAFNLLFIFTLLLLVLSGHYMPLIMVTVLFFLWSGYKLLEHRGRERQRAYIEQERREQAAQNAADLLNKPRIEAARRRDSLFPKAGSGTATWDQPIRLQFDVNYSNIIQATSKGKYVLAEFQNEDGTIYDTVPDPHFMAKLKTKLKARGTNLLLYYALADSSRISWDWHQ